MISLEFGFRTLQALIYHLYNPSGKLIVWAPISEGTEHGRGVFREALRKIILRHADGVFVNGGNGFRYIRRFGVHEKKILKIPYASDRGPFHSIPPERSAEDVYRLLYVGQLIYRKDLVSFLE